MVLMVTGWTIGIAKCLICNGACSTTGGNINVGVNGKFILLHSLHMSGLMACCVTICWRAPFGISVYARATGADMTPGELFLVTQQCICGVVLSMCMFVGLRNSIIPGVFVIHGMFLMGVSSITFCSASLICWSILFTTLCYSCVGRGASIDAMRSWSLRKSCFPLVFSFTTAAPLVWVCQWGHLSAGGETYLAVDSVAGTVRLSPVCGIPGFQVCKSCCIYNGPLMCLNTIHWRLVTPMTLLYCHPHIQQFCIQGAQGDNNSNRTGR